MCPYPLNINTKLQYNMQNHMSLHTLIQIAFTTRNVTNSNLILSPNIVNLLVHLAGLYAAIAASCRFLKPV